MRETYYNNNLETNKKENQTSNKMFCDDHRIKKWRNSAHAGNKIGANIIGRTVPGDGVGDDGKFAL